MKCAETRAYGTSKRRRKQRQMCTRKRFGHTYAAHTLRFLEIFFSA